MKKDRPGVVLCALARKEQRKAIERCLFDNTTTLGLRWSVCERAELVREVASMEVEGITVRLKVAQAFPERAKPEADDLERLSEALGWSVRRAREEVLARWRAR